MPLFNFIRKKDEGERKNSLENMMTKPLVDSIKEIVKMDII